MTVYLVGAGPGDPGLLTVRGREVLARADVIVYDRLSVASLLEIGPPTAERISVGKARGAQTVPQDEINALLVERGRRGATVVRLKGGDPFVFARGGEEAEALLAAGVPFEIVPGITSAIGVPAYAGIPVTMRHSSTSFTVVTGHEDPEHADEVDWDAVARVGGTIVVLMGAANAAAIADRLIAAGRPPDTPVAAVQWGTRPEQRTTRCTLDTLRAAALAPPVTIVVGAVAALDLGWFERRPLHGRRVVVTRAAEQAGRLSAALRDAGAEPIEVPVIALAPADDGGASLRAAAERLATFDWVVCTSVNGVDALFACLRDARSLAGVNVAAVGPATADRFRAHGVRPDLVPERFVAEGLLEVFPPALPGRGRVLVPCAAGARPVLAAGLEGLGWEAVVVEAYRTMPAPLTDEQIEAARRADVITFTSGSTVDHFVEAAGTGGLPPLVVAIGPVVADACSRHGIDVDLVADPHTVEGLVAAVIGVLSSA